MNVSRKKKSLERFQIFYQFRTSSENFLDFWQRFSAELSKQPSTRPERTFEKKIIWRLFQFVIICGNWAFFFGFWTKFFTFCHYCGFGVHKNVSKIFLQQVFFFYHFLTLSRNFFDFWPSFFSVRLPKVHSTYTEENFYGFSRNFLVFFNFWDFERKTLRFGRNW